MTGVNLKCSPVSLGVISVSCEGTSRPYSGLSMTVSGMMNPSVAGTRQFSVKVV
jgi:hypothetical protein